MLNWVLQLSDLVVFNILHLFLIFGAFCWTVWIVKFVSSRRYRPFMTDEAIYLPVSVLVPVHNERKEVLEKSLNSILNHASPDDEVLLLVDERDKGKIAAGLSVADPRLRVLHAPLGKRAALRLGFQQAKNPILVTTASDTYFTESTIPEIVKPFVDPEIGGVCARVITTNYKGIGAKCYNWILEMRNIMVYPALGKSGNVHVLNGECYAVRKKLALAYQDEFTSQSFLKKKCESGDDGWITTLLLKHGHKTFYQATAIAITEPPSSFKDFLKQQLRWNRNSVRRSVTVISQKWSHQRGLLYRFHIFVTLVKLPFWATIVVLAVIALLRGDGRDVLSSLWLEPAWSAWRPLIFIGGLILIRALRGMPYLLKHPKALAFLPLYAFIAPFILAPYKLYAMFTARNTAWLTRGDAGQITSRGRNVMNQAGLVAIISLFALSIPFVGVTLAFADDELVTY